MLKESLRRQIGVAYSFICPLKFLGEVEQCDTPKNNLSEAYTLNFIANHKGGCFLLQMSQCSISRQLHHLALCIPRFEELSRVYLAGNKSKQTINNKQINIWKFKSI